jgi:hypothetical protein
LVLLFLWEEKDGVDFSVSIKSIKIIIIGKKFYVTKLS